MHSSLVACLGRRRSILAACLLASVVAGCSVDDPLTTSPDRIPSADPGPTTSAVARPTSSATEQATFDPEIYAIAMVGCLREAGWDAVVNESGDGFSVQSVTPDQHSALESARIACDERVGPAPPPRQLSDGEIRERYQFLLRVRECLIGAGFDVSEPPSEDAFVDSWAAGPWSPFSEIEMGLERALDECPQM